MSKQFRQEIHKIFDLFQKGPPFSFSKYGDGEWAVLADEPISNGEFIYTPLKRMGSAPAVLRERLVESIRYQDPGYYIGTCCPCCNGDRARLMREFSGQPEDHMTFANVFVNANYSDYKRLFVEEYKHHQVHLVAHSSSKVENLPFQVEKFYPISRNAWSVNYSLCWEIVTQKVSGKLFLFCAGPLGNLLAHQLHDANKSNIYMDIGSTLNPWLESGGFHRDYLTPGSQFSDRECIWESQ